MGRRRAANSVILLDDLLRQPIFELVSTDARDIEIANEAFVTFGRGRGHSAALNVGDVVSYALAPSRGVSLLFECDDLSHTDLETVVTA